MFRRIEFGVRIVADSNTRDMKQEGITDPKYVYETSEFQSRTFCWCKEGEVVETNNGQGITTYSGRADNTEKNLITETNFGLIIRIKTPGMHHQKLDLKKILPFSIDIDDVSDDTFSKNNGIRIWQLFFKSIRSTFNKISHHQKGNCKIIGPTIEGVGNYPDINPQSLQIKNENIFVWEMQHGIFRGIVASMISGYFVAIQLNEIFDSSKNVLDNYSTK